MNRTHIALDAGISPAAVNQIQQMEWEEETPVGFCFWGENPGQTVFCRETGASVQVTQLLLAGNPGLLDAGVLVWQAGCLVDAGTAQTLFGTANCGGQLLWQDGKAYPVLGTVSALRPTMVMLAEPDSALDRLTFSVPAQKGEVIARQCMLRWGIAGTVLDFYPAWCLVRNTLLLVPLVLLLRFSGWVGKKNRWLGRLCILGSLWLLWRWAVIPADMIPTRWSDFEFWGNRWDAEKENFLRILLTPPGNDTLQMLANMVKSIIASTAACLTLLWPTRRKNHADIAD